MKTKTIKDSAAMRWMVLILVSGLMMATYWFQDFFSGLKGMMEVEFGFNSEEYGRLIGLTTIANMFGMIILGGMVLDKWGVRIAGLAFGGLAVLGGAITAMGASGVFGDDKSTQLTMMIIGRILFGSGLEVVCVVATTTMVKWFKGYQLALAMAINMGFGRLGSAMGIALSPDISGTVAPAVVFAAGLLGVTFLMFIIYVFFDIKLDRQLKAVKKAEALQNPDAKQEEDEEFKFSDLFKLIKNPSFIYITLLCVSFYAAVFPFIQYAPDLLINKFGFTEKLPEGSNFVIGGSKILGTALIYVGLFVYALMFSMIPPRIKNKGTKVLSLIIIVGSFGILAYYLRDVFSVWFNNGSKTASLIPLGTIIFTPIFGNFVDRKGKAASLMIIGSLLLIFAHLSLSIFNNVYLAYFGLLALGIAFSLVPAAMWPSVAKIVPQKRLGTAYSTMFTVQNWGLGLFFWGIGALLIAIPKNADTKDSIDNFRHKLEIVENEKADSIYNYVETKVYESYSDSVSLQKAEEMLPEIDGYINVVLEVRTKEDVLAFIKESKTAVLSEINKEENKEEYMIVEESFDTAIEDFSADGKLSSGQLTDLVKLMQAYKLIPFYDYTIPIFILVICGVISIFLSFKLKQADRRQNFGLELPSIKEEKEEK